MKSVDVCIATYRRPNLLKKTIESLVGQVLDEIQMRIIVVDNDCNESARETVESLCRKFPCDIIYVVEPVQNISMARNHALKEVEAEYFTFIDDDEIATSTWLKVLLECQSRFNADAVFGPVIGLLPINAPKWAAESSCFNRPRKSTGTKLNHGGTGNVLVRKTALGEPPQQFDVSYGRTGGEDTEFFNRMHLAGKNLVWCDEAVVEEIVHPCRLTESWVLKRSYRGGQSFARIYVNNYSRGKWLGWLFKKIIQLLGAMVVMPLARVIYYPYFVRIASIMASNLGQLSIILRRQAYEEYQASTYK